MVRQNACKLNSALMLSLVLLFGAGEALAKRYAYSGNSGGRNGSTSSVVAGQLLLNSGESLDGAVVTVSEEGLFVTFEGVNDRNAYTAIWSIDQQVFRDDDFRKPRKLDRYPLPIDGSTFSGDGAYAGNQFQFLPGNHVISMTLVHDRSGAEVASFSASFTLEAVVDEPVIDTGSTTDTTTDTSDTGSTTDTTTDTADTGSSTDTTTDTSDTGSTTDTTTDTADTGSADTTTDTSDTGSTTDTTTDTADTGSTTDTTTDTSDTTTTQPTVAQLSWTFPAAREDGSALLSSELAAFRIYYYEESTPAGEGDVIHILAQDYAGQYALELTTPGSYVFAIDAVDTDGMHSDLSETVIVEVY